MSNTRPTKQGRTSTSKDRKRQHSATENLAEPSTITPKAIETQKKPPKKAKRRKKVPLDERSWNGEHYRSRLNPENIPPSRFGTNNDIVLPSGENVKTTCLVQGVVGNTPINPDFTNVSTHSQATVTETSKNGSPTVAVTPHGTKLRRRLKLPVSGTCSLHFLDNIGGTTSVPVDGSPSPLKLSADHHFFKSVSFEAIIPPTTTTKEEIITITPELLAKTRRAKKQNLGRRLGKNQNAVMVRKGIRASQGSAAQYMAATKTAPAERTQHQWLHLIAHAIAGESTQSVNNLVAGSREANVQMGMIEENIYRLSKTYPEGFELRVKTELIPNTHIPTSSIFYGIKTKDFALNLKINAHSTVEIPYDYKKYFQIFLQALLKESKRIEISKKLDFDAPSTSGSTPSPSQKP